MHLIPGPVQSLVSSGLLSPFSTNSIGFTGATCISFELLRKSLVICAYFKVHGNGSGAVSKVFSCC